VFSILDAASASLTDLNDFLPTACAAHHEGGAGGAREPRRELVPRAVTNKKAGQTDDLTSSSFTR